MKNKDYVKKYFFLGLSLVFTLMVSFVEAQKWDVNGNIIIPSNFLGTINNQDLQFKTSGIAFERMIIKKQTGFVGIGTNFFNPLHLLDVKGGDIDVSTPSKGYMINDKYVLWYNSTITDIFVGLGAGINTPVGAPNNTFVGYKAGALGNALFFSDNAFVGTEAGLNAQGHLNAFLGSKAGWSGGGSGNNTMIGAEAGYLDSQGDENTFVGWRSGYNCVTGYHNAFLGNVSGANTSSGANNTFVGIGSGSANTIGSGNTALGAGAGPGSGNLNNAAAIGAGTQVMQNDQLILGNSTQFVGIGLSGNPVGPGNYLEINTPATSPFPGASGLRFRDLTNVSTPVTNPGKGVLAVNPNGDVIYVNVPTSSSPVLGAHNGTSMSTLSTGLVAFGQDVAQSGSPGQLLNDREIPTNNFNIRLTDPILSTPGQNLVSLGNPYGGPSTGNPKLYTDNHTEPIAIKGMTDAFNVTSITPNVGDIGVMGHVVNSNWQYATGVYGLSEPLPGTNNWSYGVFGETVLNSPDMAIAIGVRGNSSSPNNVSINCGGWFTAANAGNTSGLSGINYGVYGWIPPSQNGYAVYSDGNLFVNGNGFATGTFTWSDKRLKKEIGSITNAMDLLNRLKPSTYFYDTENKYNLRFSDQKQYGLIAQEVESVLPEIVKEVIKPAEYGKDGKELSPSATLKTINYTEIIPLLIQAVQEQQKSIEDLQNQVSNLTTVLRNSGLFPNATSDASTLSTNINLSRRDVVILNQNVPNPFTEQTVISYEMPDNSGDAQLLFFNNVGQMIKTIDLTTKGKGQLTVYGNDLSNGIYTYSLVIDGKTIDTKKMVKTK